MRAGMLREMGWQVDEKVNRDKTGEADNKQETKSNEHI